MTDQERDAAAASGADGATEGTGADEPDELKGDEELEGDHEEEFEDAEAATPAGFAPVAPAVPRGRRLRGQPTTVAAPSVSERAVRVDDRFSSWYVIALVAVFGLIFANAILFGHSGFISGLFPTPTPIVTASPVPSASS